jgi:hypothetical protein
MPPFWFRVTEFFLSVLPIESRLPGFLTPPLAAVANLDAR